MLTPLYSISSLGRHCNPIAFIKTNEIKGEYVMISASTICFYEQCVDASSYANGLNICPTQTQLFGTDAIPVEIKSSLSIEFHYHRD